MVVALWKDPAGGIREVPLEPGAQGVLLVDVRADRATRHSADGRWPVDDTAHLRDVGVHQVRATVAGLTAPATAAASEPSDPPGGTGLDERDLTVLASWAEALAEAGTPPRPPPWRPTPPARRPGAPTSASRPPSPALAAALGRSGRRRRFARW